MGENSPIGENMEDNINGVEKYEEEIKKIDKQTKRGVLAFLIIIPLVVLILIGALFGDSDKYNTETYAKYAVQDALENYVLYPDTLKVKSIKYRKSINKEKGTELWVCEGYFTAESKIGLEVKYSYTVFLTYTNSTDKWTYSLVYIDGELMTT